MSLHRTAALGLALWLAGCSAMPSEPPPRPRSFPGDAERPAPEVVRTRTVTESGGFLDWCAASERIAFSRESRRRNTSEIYTIRADGSDERCITCESPDLAGARGSFREKRARLYRSNPAWHPSCAFLVIHVGGAHFRPSRYERPPFGIHNDLWLLAADGTWAERIVEVEELGGAMGAVFSDTGERLLWSARRPTGRKIRQGLLNRTPGRENPWVGWSLAIADFERPPGGPAALSNRTEPFRERKGILRPSALTADTVWFSHTQNPQSYVDEIFRALTDGTGWVNLSRSPGTWEEQPDPSPWGSLLAYRSSRPTAWKHPPHPLGTLRLELWALTRDGERVPLTQLNDRNPKRRVKVEDYAWGPHGRRIAIYTVKYEIDEEPRHAIEILELNHAF